MRRPDRPHDRQALSDGLGRRPPVAGGLDLSLPGVDVRLAATRWPGTGPPVVLLHGLSQTRRFWDLVVPGLAGLPVLALDQRGHGDSDRPDGPYDVATVAGDVLTALDALGLSRAVVVGHSWGAWTALRLAALAPSRVLAVVAVDGGFGLPLPPGVDRAEMRRRLTPPQIALPPAEVPGLVAVDAPWWSPEATAAVLPLFGVDADGRARPRLPRSAHLAVLDDLLDDDPEPFLPRITCPAWVVACTQAADGAGDRADDDAPRLAALAAAGRLLPRPRLLHWSGAVHDVPLQWPALIAGLIRSAVDEVRLEPSGEGRQA